MTDVPVRGERPSDVLAKRVGSVLLIGSMFFAAWVVMLVGFAISICLDGGDDLGPCTKSDAPLWWGLAIGGVIVLATGPMAWLLSGRRSVFLATPLLVVPVFALMRGLPYLLG